MATTKTLTPTNETITIDAFQGEKPDHRHVADAETKLADAVNALNSKITNVGDFVTTETHTTNVSSGNAFHVIDTITPGEGYYLLISNVSFANNAADARSASLSLDANADTAWFVNEMASPTGSTTMQIVRYHAFSSQQSMNLLVRQLSGVALDVTCRTFAIKLK